ncbi:MAG: hypothetical protein K2K28_01835 [Clostridia bacterium]|nr:hypothetical protein [Clostridia bacterium]
MQGRESTVPDNDTIIGALSAHISAANKNFQPMNANFGILKAAEKNIRDKKQRYAHLAQRALDSIKNYKNKLGI